MNESVFAHNLFLSHRARDKGVVLAAGERFRRLKTSKR